MAKPQDPEGSAALPWLGLAQYHSIEMLAMLQRYDQVANLIGQGHHSESEGDWCEDLLRGFLRDTLPKRFSIDTGFILGAEARIPWFPNHSMPSKTTRVTPQLDVIIHDTQDYSPILRTGEFVVVLPDSVCAVIEVKKRLDSKNLKCALQVLATTRWLVEQCWLRKGSRRLFTSVFSFESISHLQGAEISKSFRNRYQEISRSYPASCAIPDLLVVGNDKYLEVINRGGTVKVRVGPALQQEVNISGQLLVFHLMKSMNTPEIDSKIGRFQLPGIDSAKREFEISSPKEPFDYASIVKPTRPKPKKSGSKLS